jgi:16S rRNA processing protein RimM
VATQQADEFIAIGKVGASYGVKGWVKIHSFTEWASNMLEYTPWYFQDKNGWQLAKIVDGREHGKIVIVKVAGYDAPEQSRLLTGTIIGIKRSQLPTLKKDEYYWRDLEGLTVIDREGRILGTVTHLLETGSNDVLVIKNDNKEYAIPYLPKKVILSVDLTKREIHVDWELI